MAKVLVVTSGKGGVGKTTSTAALGAAAARTKTGTASWSSISTSGLRNLDLVMGAERRVVFDLINVVQGVAKLPQALIRDKRLDNLWLLPASQTRDKDALTDEGVGRIVAEPENQIRLGSLRQPGRYRAWRDAGDALRGRSGHHHQSRGLLGA